MLIAVNPFKSIKGAYTEGKIREYRGKKFYELPPHVFALADDTHNQVYETFLSFLVCSYYYLNNKMINKRENQCVIISGESGRTIYIRIVDVQTTNKSKRTIRHRKD